MADKLYSLDEVKAHRTADSLWIIFYNHVYDVTEYTDLHPGGKQYLLENGGLDATTLYEDVGHSADAREIMEKYLVGKLRPEDRTDNSSERRLPEVVPRAPHIGTAHITQPNRRQFSAVVAGVVFTTLGVAKHQKWLPSIQSVRSDRFWHGFFIAAIVSMGVGGMSAYYASRFLSIPTRDFASYPAHIPAKVANSVAKKKDINLGILNPLRYQLFPLVEKTALSGDAFRLVFALPHPNDIAGLPTGQHIGVRAMINGQQVIRSYTPSSSNKDLGRIELTVRIYDRGLMTQHLKTLEVGDHLEIRGPKGAMKYHKNLVSEIGMVAGGTGITPMYSMIRQICEDPRDTTKISLIYCSKTEADILLKHELDGLAKSQPHNLSVHYVVHDPHPRWAGSVGRVNKDMVERLLPKPNGAESKVMVCGPPGLEKAAVGWFVEMGFKPPGSISRASDQIFLFQ